MKPVREQKHRLPREAYRGRVTVSITACISDRKSPFLEPQTVEAFLGKLEKATSGSGCRVLIYCFMPDHLHLILQGIADTADAWKAMVDFKQATGFWFANHRPEFSWQKDFHDHVLRSDEDWGAHLRYVASNPVRRELVSDWQDYPFTGAIGYDYREILVQAAAL